ncbi:MAG: DUF302 domain-containing protein [Gammaproteobacteria bacterium]|nr:DUF302 domain-containing protein [Gammaproteobacteria bacterium]
MKVEMKRLLAMVLLTGFLAVAGGAQAATPQVNIEDTVVKMPLADGVGFADAVESMKLRANIHNMKLVAELPLSKQVESMGQKARHMAIYQFCDPLTAQRMVEANIHFAAYLPCRIALVEDEKGQGWLVMMNLDMMLQGATLTQELKLRAGKVRDVLMDIMQAGANGDL